MSKQSEAVKNYIEEHCLVQKDIAQQMGISPASFNNMLAGRDAIGKRRAQKLHDIFGFDIVFLITGEGSLFGGGPVQHVEVSHNSGSSRQNVTVSAPSQDADVAALKAQVEALKAENTRLWSMIDRMTGK